MHIKKFFSLDQANIINSEYLVIYSIIFFLFFLYFVSNYNNIQPAEGQINMDSFTAKGIIFSKTSQSPLFENQNRSINESPNSLLNNSLSSQSSSNTTANNLLVIEGGWELVVKKGEVSLFQVIFTLSKDEKIVNAFAIENLKNNRYVQINDKGMEMISGTVDFLSAGLKNATLSNVDATITIRGLTQLRISLDDTMVGQYIKNPLIGVTRVFLDANGNLLLGPRPEPPPSPPPN